MKINNWINEDNSESDRNVKNMEENAWTIFSLQRTNERKKERMNEWRKVKFYLNITSNKWKQKI